MDCLLIDWWMVKDQDSEHVIVVWRVEIVLRDDGRVYRSTYRSVLPCGEAVLNVYVKVNLLCSVRTGGGCDSCLGIGQSQHWRSMFDNLACSC